MFIIPEIGPHFWTQEAKSDQKKTFRDFGPGLPHIKSSQFLTDPDY